MYYNDNISITVLGRQCVWTNMRFECNWFVDLNFWRFFHIDSISKPGIQICWLDCFKRNLRHWNSRLVGLMLVSAWHLQRSRKETLIFRLTFRFLQSNFWWFKCGSQAIDKSQDTQIHWYTIKLQGTKHIEYKTSAQNKGNAYLI
jgi:hypothetical protein